jgi:FdrA protein
MTSKVIVKKATYRDSISLMKISNTVSSLPGVTQAAVAMATELNRRVLSEAGFGSAAIGSAASEDMIVAVEAKDGKSLSAAFAETERLLSMGETQRGEKVTPASLEEALEVVPKANLAFISVPGRFAKREAMRALERGLNVFLFSSNVPLEEEVELKRVAKEKRLLVMGPDCGTSIVNHKVLGFGNAVRAGAVGLISASGTGLQEVTTLIHKAGLGISQAIGTGGGDLSEEVGGTTMIQGMELLEADKQTRVIVLISKPPAAGTAKYVLEAAKRCTKPVVVNFLGADFDPSTLGSLRPAKTLDDAARAVCELSGSGTPFASAAIPEWALSMALAEHKKLVKSQRYVRGLFAGGTLCYESQYVLRPLVGEVYSNAPVNSANEVPGDEPSKRHTCIDMGAEEFVQGRAHPMIDFSLRNMRILQEARDPETAVVLIDVELGWGSNADPAGQLIPFVQKAKALGQQAGRHVAFVASVIGTDGDFQGLTEQEKALSGAGVLVMPSNAQATKVSALIALGGEVEATILGRSD